MINFRIPFFTLLIVLVATTQTACVTNEDGNSLADIEALGCPAEPSRDNCQTYTCIDLETPCGNEGYAKNYGDRYCKQFQSLCDDTLFTEKEKQWVLATTLCLQSVTYESQLLGDSCGEIERKSFEAHSNCFMEGALDLGGPSFCSLGPSSWQRIRKCFVSGDKFSRQGLKQISKTVIACGKVLNETSTTDVDTLGLPDKTIRAEWSVEAKKLGAQWQEEAGD